MYILIFILGIIIGSFLNVCIYRIPRSESIVFPPSHCTYCSSPLKWYDLIPVFSFILLKGKCRYCRGDISPQYPIVELLNGLLYVILFYYFQLSLDFFYFCIIVSILLVISFIDYYHQIIPDILLVFIIIITVLYRFLNYYIYKSYIPLPDSILGFLGAGVLFTIIALVSKGGMGGGDIKLIAVLGFILGWKKIILNILLSFIIGAAAALYLILSNKKGRKDPIPFGPFINISFFITCIWGEAIILLYLKTILV